MLTDLRNLYLTEEENMLDATSGFGSDVVLQSSEEALASLVEAIGNYFSY